MHFSSGDNVGFAIFLTFLAGISTGIGSLIAYFTKRTNTSFLAGSLGFSAGVMLYISFIEIIAKSKNLLAKVYSESVANLLSTIGFFVGIALIALIDFLVPSFENPHELKNVEDLHPQQNDAIEKAKLIRMGWFSAIAITLHNFPEGLATFIAALHEIKLGLSMAVAVAIHNIPEGIAVSVPIYYATGSKKKALFLSFLSGLAEPLGGIVAYIVIKFFSFDTNLGMIFATIAGIMVYISLDELLPSAERYGKHHIAIIGVISGMAIMAISLLLFQK